MFLRIKVMLLAYAVKISYIWERIYFFTSCWRPGWYSLVGSYWVVYSLERLLSIQWGTTTSSLHFFYQFWLYLSSQLLGFACHIQVADTFLYKKCKLTLPFPSWYLDIIIKCISRRSVWKSTRYLHISFTRRLLHILNIAFLFCVRVIFDLFYLLFFLGNDIWFYLWSCTVFRVSW